MNCIHFFVFIALSISSSFSYGNTFPHYKGAEAFAPVIRDRFNYDKSAEKFLPVKDSSKTCSLIQLTDDTFWLSEQGSFSPKEWSIGQTVLIERGMDQDQGAYWLIDLATASRKKIKPAPQYYITDYTEREEEGSDRYYSLPLLDKPCLFKLNSRIDRVQIGARKILWEFEPVVYNYLPLLDWNRGVIINIHGSGNPDYPYWIVYSTEDGTWVPALLVKPDPIQIASIEVNP